MIKIRLVSTSFKPTENSGPWQVKLVKVKVDSGTRSQKGRSPKDCVFNE
jgi:hypothetical protein